MKPKAKWITLGIAGSAVIVATLSAILFQRGDLSTNTIADLREVGNEVIDTLADVTGANDRRRDDDMDPETRAQIDAALAKLEGGGGDASRGRAIFEERCVKCHVYNGEGQRVGPELTFTDRNNVNKLLELIMDPSDYVREEYRATEFVVNGDSETEYITGFVLLENETHIMVTDTAAEVITIDKELIEEQYPVMGSIMPDGLLDDLSDTQLRDLIAYLQEVPAPEDSRRDGRRGRDDDDDDDDRDRQRWRDDDDDDDDRQRWRDDDDDDRDRQRWRDDDDDDDRGRGRNRDEGPIVASPLFEQDTVEE